MSVRAGRAARLAAGLVAVALALVAPTAGALAATGTRAQVTPVDPGAELRLDRQTAWVDPGATFTARLHVEGEVPEGATVTTTVHGAAGSRSEFAQQVQGNALGDQIATPVTEAVADTEDPSVDVRVATDGSPGPGEVDAELSGAGVYPVEVRLAGPGGEELDRLVTHLVRLPAAESEAPSLRLALVVPVDGGPGIRPNGARRVDRAAGRRVSALLDALTTHPDVAATVVPTPETVVTASGTPRIARFRRAVAGRQVVASQYVPVEVAAWVTAGLEDDLARQTTAGEQALAEHLVDRPDRRTAVAAPTLTPEALTRLEELGTDQVVVPAEALAPLDTDQFPTTLAQPFGLQDSEGRPVRALAADPGLAAHVDETGDPVLDASNLLADLAVVWLDQPTQERGVSLVLPRTWEPTDAFLDTLLDALAQPSVVRAVSVDDLLAEVPPATAGGADDPDGDPLVRTLAPTTTVSLGSYPDALRLTRLTVEGFASFAGRDNPVVGSMQRRLLVSGSADLARDQRKAYLDAISRQITHATESVVAPRSGNVTLTSRDGRIPLNLSNENLYDVTVRLRFQSDKLTFPDGGTVIVHLPASTVTSLDVDVRARSSGTFPLRLTITSPDEIVLVSRSRFTVRSTAVSGVGLFLSVGAGLFLALWWASHFRKVRRARGLVAADEAAAAVAAAEHDAAGADDANL